MATLDVQVSIDAPAVDRAMVASGDRCEQLARALEFRDTTAIESTAEHAVNVWLAGREAYWRLLVRYSSGSMLVKDARGRLHAAFRQTLELLSQATCVVDAPETYDVLIDLGGTLMRAMSHPSVLINYRRRQG